MSHRPCVSTQSQDFSAVDERARDLVAAMTLEEKIGQMSQANGGAEGLREMVRDGRLGSVLNEVNVDELNELQRIAVEESRLGIPLLVGRDVIHGFKTIFPIPLGQAASWDPELIEQAASVAAREAAASGINWTFAPMVDISRDPRWGRIAESLGEDPYLTSVLGAAMVRGFVGQDECRPPPYSTDSLSVLLYDMNGSPTQPISRASFPVQYNFVP